MNMDSMNATEPPATEVTATAKDLKARGGLLELNESPRHVRVRNMSTSEKGDRSFVRGRLVVVSDLAAGLYIYLDAPLLTVGRGRDADVMVLDDGVSRLHARLVRHEDGFRIIDADSENGTYLNGRSIREAELYDGDVIALGQTQLQYEGVGWRRRLAERPSMVPAVFQSGEASSDGSATVWPNFVIAALTTFIFVALVSLLRGPMAPEPKAIAQEWYTRAQQSVTESRWLDARDEIEIAKVLGLAKAPYEALIHQVEREMADEELTHMIHGSIVAGQPISTIKTLQERVSKNTPTAQRISQAVSKEVDRRVARWLRDAKRAHMAADHDRALLRLDRILDLRPENAEAKRLRLNLQVPNLPTRPGQPEDQKQHQ